MATLKEQTNTLKELSEKVDRIERRLDLLEDKFTDSFDLAQETSFIKVFFVFCLIINFE